MNEADPEEVFEYYRTPRALNLEVRHLGVEEAQAIKRLAVLNGFCDEAGNPAPDLGWLAKLVIFLRHSTTGDESDHEWWGAEISKPTWVRNLDKIYGISWLYFPDKVVDFEPAEVGERFALLVTKAERTVGRASTDSEFLIQWHTADLNEMARDIFAEDAGDIQPTPELVESFSASIAEWKSSAPSLRQSVFAFVEKQDIEAAHRFREGFQKGASKEMEIDLSEQFSQMDRHAEILRILSEHWDTVSGIKNRTLLARFVCSRLPPRMRSQLEAATKTKTNTGAWQSFAGQIRDICDVVGLRLASRGRPPKNTDG